MHIAEGVLSLPVLLGGAAVAIAGIRLGLDRLETDAVPLAAVMAAGFFVASLVQVPTGVSTVHLLLNGLCGALLGWVAFPVIFIGLLLQTMMFGFGGLTSLGVNTVIMAAPAVLCYFLFARRLQQAPAQQVFWLGCATGGLAIFCGTILLCGSLYLSGGEAFLPLLAIIAAAHFPVMLVEALITGSALAFIRQTQPELLALSERLQGAQ